MGGPETASNTWFSSPQESATALKAASDWFSRFAPLTRVPVAHRPRRYSQHRQQRLHHGPHDVQSWRARTRPMGRLRVSIDQST